MLGPLLLLGALEVLLRLRGYGYPTGFFVSDTHGGKPVYHENRKFGWRFFGPKLARAPWPTTLPAGKAPDTLRIFVFGESAAYGDPQPEFGLSRMLNVLLRERYPGTRFEVINAAMTAINSHAILPIARDCAKRDGDIWVLYMGNNEVVGPFGSGTVFGRQIPNLAFIRGNLALKSTRTGQLLGNVSSRIARGGPAQSEWGGMAMFLGNQVREDDPRMQTTYAHFEQNLRDILQLSVRHRVKTVVSTVASNLRDCAPFASTHRPGLTDAQAAEWTRLFDSARSTEDAEQAIALFKKAAAIDDRYADLQYLWAKACLRTHAAEAAREHFRLARDYDTLRFRADTRINDVIRRAASGREKEAILLCDAEAALAARSPDGVAGSEYFHEHVHFNFEGNYALALSIAAEVAKFLPLPNSADGASRDWPSSAECARQLGWTDWNRYEGLAAMRARLGDPPFTGQQGHEEQLLNLRSAMERLSPALGREHLLQYAAEYKAALQSSPDDWVLWKNYARLLQKTGDTNGMLQARQQVARVLPHDPEALTALGLAWTEAGDAEKALSTFQAALACDANSIRALNGYGLALASKNRHEEALKLYERALELDPDSTETQFNLVTTLKALGQTNEANLRLRQTLTHKPNSSDALVELGKMCLGQGWVNEAITNFNRALALDPAEAEAHFCLARTMEMQRRWPEAQSHYAEAVRLRPEHAEARVGLGAQLGMAGKDAEALEQFSRAVALNPQLLEARLNLGIALVRAGRAEEATVQFQEALRLRPGNPTALKFLQQLRPKAGL